MRVKKRSDGRYAKQVYIGTVDGKRKYKTFYSTQLKEVERMAAEYRASISAGFDPKQKQISCKELFDFHISQKRRKGVGESWLKTLELFSRHLSPLWNIPVDKVKTMDVQSALDDLDGLSHKTITQILSFARAAFDLAIPERIQYNPCMKAVAPAGKPSETRRWLSHDEQRMVRETPHRAQIAAMLMMYSGLRRGEATALQWSDIDLKNRAITVNKSWDFVADKQKAPKTAAGNRTVYIPQILCDFLQAHKENSQYVVHTADGKHMTNSAWKRLWESYMNCLNAKYAFNEASVFATRKKDKDGKERGALPIVIKTFTPHELRHTFCTLLYEAGIDVVTARDQMGHSDISVTLGIYTHLDKEQKARKMDALDAFLLSQN